MNHNYVQFLLGFLFILFILVYIFAVFRSNQRYRKWPVKRVMYWVFGVLSVALAVIGPIPHLAHHDFTLHMVVHLLLGMLAPILFVLAAPVTLLVRNLNVQVARKVTRFLKSGYIKFLTNPIVSSFINIGGLWLLYTSDLYHAMNHNMLLHLFIHIHIFVAGYFFTASFIYIDPTPQRYSFVFRSTIFILATAAHGILSKYIYANPPMGVPENQARSGGMLMYYIGDFIDMFIILIICYQWYQSSFPRKKLVFEQ